jgi:serine/threonine-protein kinase
VSTPENRDRIGAYRLVRRLGSGGMGEVFLAYDERLDRLVALKRVRPEAAGDPGRRERLRREARAAARLVHPNVVQVFDLVEGSGEEGDSVVFEYVQGSTVAELLRDGPLPPATAVRLGVQVALGLAAAHAAGLIHRDLKAENVVVTPEGEAKILDFGLVKPLEAGAGGLTDDGALLGTWRTMSPEQAQGEAVEASSDLFSLGVLLFEMLAGRSPFEGRSPVETLRRLTDSSPAPFLTDLRPELPADLAGMVGMLLQKRPEDRPATARWVAGELRGMEGGMGGSAAGQPAGSGTTGTPFAYAETKGPSPPGGGGLAAGGGQEGGRSDPAKRPWSTEGAAPLLSSPLSQPPPPRGEGPFGAPTQAPVQSQTQARTGSFTRELIGHPRRLASVILVLLVLGLTAAAFPWLRARLGLADAEPLRVALLRPQVPTDSSEDLRLASSGAVAAALRGLLALQELTPVDPAQIGDVHGSAVEVARAVAADEALSATFDGSGRAGSLSLQRIRVSDGAVVWAERVPVPLAPEDSLVLADAVSAAVRRAYSDHPPRPGRPVLEVRAADYTEFLRIKLRLDAGRSGWAPELGRLEAAVAGSPRFTEGHLQVAALALNLFDDTKDPAYLTRARAALERARALEPDGPSGDPRVSAVGVRLALTERRWPEAEARLAELESRSPGDVLLLIQRSRLAEARGRLDEAIALLTQAIDRRPGWRDLLRLAELEVRGGQVDAARKHLERAMERVPGNDWPVAKLGELELLYGDPRRAETLYLRLSKGAAPQRSDFTNLGLARALLGDFQGAAESYRKALAIEPGHVTVLLNLGDAELALGHREIARQIYVRALAEVDSRPDASLLQPVERTIRAQLLARLGRTREAVALALDTFQSNPEESEVAYQTALVLALAGDESSALAAAGKALDLGIRPRWFTLPGFERLRADPDFQRRLSGDLPLPLGRTR